MSEQHRTLLARRALVVGGGIAGSAAAWWLHRTGWNVTLVDAQEGPPAGGFVLDLDETSQRILRSMGAGHIIEQVSFPSPTTKARLTGGRRPLQLSFSGGQSRLGRV